MMTVTRPLRVFCVDDNPLVIDALRLQLSRAGDMHWHGFATNAQALLDQVRGDCPDVILLDIDMPGKDPFEAIEDLEAICSQTRVLMYSGLVRGDLVDRALDAGAWGYVAKVDGEQALLEAIRMAASGAIAFSPSVRTAHG